MGVIMRLTDAVPRIPGVEFVSPVNWQVGTGEIWAIAGDNGSGKSLLAEVITGQYGLSKGEITYPFLDKLQEGCPGKMLHAWEFIKIVGFNATYSIVDFRQLYYQQRFNSTETEESPYVRDLLQGMETKHPVTDEIVRLLDIAKLLNRRLIQLSSGELRKLLIAKVMATSPRMLIFDNPFIGLDAASREQLNGLFVTMNRQGIRLLFLAPSVNDLPACTEMVLEMDKLRVVSVVPAAVYR